MAVYLNNRTGYPIYGLVAHSYPDEGDRELVHAFVVAPDGRALDANGFAPIEKMGSTGLEWERHIGEDRHPVTGEPGQWWLNKLEPLSIAELCELREACNDPLDRALLVEAEAWVNERGFLDPER